MENNVVDTLRIEVEANTEKAVKGIDGLSSALKRIKKISATKTKDSSTEIAAISAAIKSIDEGDIKKIQSLASALERLGAVKISKTIARNLSGITGKVFSAPAVASPATDTANRINDITEPITDTTNTEQIEETATAVENLGEEFANAGNEGEEAGRKGSCAIKKIKSSVTSALGPVSRFFKMFEKRLIYRGLNALISGITNLFKTGVNNLYQYSKTINGTFAASMDTISTAVNYLRNSVGAACAPIINALAPVIDRLADKAVNLLDTLNQVISRLSGAKTWTKAIKGTSEYATATGKAAKANKELKKSILGIDEINALSDNSSATNDSVSTKPSSVYKFEELPIDTAKIDKIINRLKVLGVIVGSIAAGFIAWKISSNVLGFVSAISTLFGKGMSVGGKTSGGITNVKGTLKAMASIGIIIGGVVSLITTLGLLMKIPGFKETIKSGTSSLSIVFNGIRQILLPLTLLSAGMVLLGKIKVATVAKGAANTAIIIGGVTVLITAIGALMSIPHISDFMSTGIATVINIMNGLMSVAVPIGLLSAYMIILGVIPVQTVALGLANMAIILAGTTVVLTAIGALMSIPGFSEFSSSGVKAVQDILNGLYEVALPLGVLSALLIALGIATPTVILSGLAGFALVIGGLSLVLVALGALRQIDGFEWIIGEGGKVLCQLGEILGSFAASLITGFADKVTDILPMIGEKLSLFMTNAEPFFSGLERIDESTAVAAQALAGCILALTAAAVLEGLTSWITGGRSLEQFGAMLPEFGKNMNEYSRNVDGIKSAVVEESAKAAKAVAEVAKNLPLQGGLLGLVVGERQSLLEFGKMLPEFGTNLRKYSKNVDGIKADVVEASSKAAKSITEIAENLPLYGGLLGLLAGERQTLSDFGAMLPSFGRNLKDYSDRVRGLDTNVVVNSANAAKAISEVADNLPTEGGIKEFFVGSNGIDVFGEKLASFGRNFAAYYDYVKGFSISILNTAASALKTLVDSAVKIKSNSAADALEDFADSLASAGKDFQKFFESKFSPSKASDIGYNYGKNFANAVAKAIRATAMPNVTGTITSASGGKNNGLQFEWRAAGGLVDTGQMFVAREAGPEMVGTIGRRTAVANNDQIVESVAQGVADANAEQNALLREQNSILRGLLEKDPTVKAVVSADSIINGLDRKNRRDGKTIIPVGV